MGSSGLLKPNTTKKVHKWWELWCRTRMFLRRENKTMRWKRVNQTTEARRTAQWSHRWLLVHSWSDHFPFAQSSVTQCYFGDVSQISVKIENAKVALKHLFPSPTVRPDCGLLGTSRTPILIHGCSPEWTRQPEPDTCRRTFAGEILKILFTAAGFHRTSIKGQMKLLHVRKNTCQGSVLKVRHFYLVRDETEENTPPPHRWFTQSP